MEDLYYFLCRFNILIYMVCLIKKCFWIPLISVSSGAHLTQTVVIELPLEKFDLFTTLEVRE